MVKEIVKDEIILTQKSETVMEAKNMFRTFNTQELIDSLSGHRKAFIQHVAKQQFKKYNNEDVFTADVRSICQGIVEVSIWFGDLSFTYYFDVKTDKLFNKVGTGQYSKYQHNIQSCAEELYSICMFANK